ncbi:Tos7p [Sporobolomyces koalae]|uniref:Tos7p n=1 Tax=Sporobolomyces koalae TaxID=500713 RepID=UPI0031754133
MAVSKIIHYTGTFALLAAMALLIVASVSSPIWNHVGYLKGRINGQDITFGNWGWCTANACTKAKLGYPRNFISELTGQANIASQTVLRNLSFTLILTPIAAGITFIALLFALGTHLILGILGSLAAFFSFLVTIVALGLYLGLFIVTRNRINTLGLANTNLSISSQIWLVVAAAGCQLYATATVCFTRSRRKRAAREEDFAAVPAMSSTQHEYVTTAPSTVGSTGPLVHDHTGINNGAYSATNSTYAANPVSENYVDPAANTNYVDSTATHADNNGHFWQRKTTTAI